MNVFVALVDNTDRASWPPPGSGGFHAGPIKVSSGTYVGEFKKFVQAEAKQMRGLDIINLQVFTTTDTTTELAVRAKFGVDPLVGTELELYVLYKPRKETEGTAPAEAPPGTAPGAAGHAAGADGAGYGPNPFDPGTQLSPSDIAFLKNLRERDDTFRSMRLFLRSAESDPPPSDVKGIIKDMPCCICDRRCNKHNQRPLSNASRSNDSVGSTPCAHLLRTEEDAEELGVPWDISNFLPLCGTQGRRGTCHDAFDTQQIFFLHVPPSSADPSAASDPRDGDGDGDGDAGTTAVKSEWVVVGCGKYADYFKGDPCKRVLLDPVLRPHRRTLHEHAKAVWHTLPPKEREKVKEAVQRWSMQKGGTTVEIEAWIDQTTPPQSTEVSLRSNAVAATGEQQNQRHRDPAHTEGAAAAPAPLPSQRDALPAGVPTPPTTAQAGAVRAAPTTATIQKAVRKASASTDRALRAAATGKVTHGDKAPGGHGTAAGGVTGGRRDRSGRGGDRGARNT